MQMPFPYSCNARHAGPVCPGCHASLASALPLSDIRRSSARLHSFAFERRKECRITNLLCVQPELNRLYDGKEYECIMCPHTHVPGICPE